jgi:nucleoside-triphosphatase
MHPPEGSTGANILLTGRPGAGKTTVLMRALERLGGIEVGGFYTEEIREEHHRVGFDAVTLSGRRATLAHVGVKSRHRVGRYGVDVQAFERLVLPELARTCDVMLIDEIGKMECFSASFVKAARRLLDGTTLVVASVAATGPGLIRDVKDRRDVELWEVTRANRDELPQALMRRIEGGQTDERRSGTERRQ